MTSIDQAFGRALLALVHRDVRKAFPDFGDLMQVASVTGPSLGCYFVEIVPDGIERFYWEGNASDKYEARFKAWHAFLRKYGKEPTE